MKIETINSPKSHSLNTGYSQAVLVTDAKRTLYISGQIGLQLDGSLSNNFKQQAKQVWSNIQAQLKHADMDLENIVHHRTFLSDRKYTAENSAIRREILGDLEPALTVVITGIFNKDWLLEIEAVAVQ